MTDAPDHRPGMVTLACACGVVLDLPPAAAADARKAWDEIHHGGIHRPVSPEAARRAADSSTFEGFIAAAGKAGRPVKACPCGSTVELRVEASLDEAERKAWDSLARYKFQMFGYWAAIWVHLNRVSGGSRTNPFKSAVQLARGRQQGEFHAAADVEVQSASEAHP